jgi:hypothetical protein
MSVRLAFLALLVCVATSPGADQQLSTLKGEVIKGEVVSISDTEVVFDQGGKRVTHLIKDVVRIDLRDVGKPPAKTSYTLVELTDGSLLQCSKWAIKGKSVELTLLSGGDVKFPLEALGNLLTEAQQESHRKDWQTRLARRPTSDILVTRRTITDKKTKTDRVVISGFEVTLGEGSADGTQIEYTYSIDTETKTVKRSVKDVHGLIFRRKLNPKAPPVVCKLFDTAGDVVMVSKAASKAGNLTVTTPAGASIEYKLERVARMDYTTGKLEYLSEKAPDKTVVRSNLEDDDKSEQQHVYKDSSLLRNYRLAVGGTIYPKGLVLRPHVELEYDLKGEFRTFSAVVGFVDNVTPDGVTVLVIEGDGKELQTVTLSEKDTKRAQTVTLNIKDVQKLRIIAKSGDWFDWGKHIALADAKVSK